MITPRFELSQTSSDIIIKIYAPYANIGETEVHIEEDDFRFYSSPYYLRLHLPGNVQENDASRASYDADTGTLNITVSKVIKGQHFPDLDLITTLLTPQKHKNKLFVKPNIQVVGEIDVTPEDDEAGSEWFWEQKVPEPVTPEMLLGQPKYGFANQSQGVFENFKDEHLEIIDLPEPDTTHNSERSELCKQRELHDFSADHYLANLLEDTEEIQALLAYKTPWEIQLTDKTDDSAPSQKELDTMKDLPRKEYLLDDDAVQVTYLGLVDILFAYCYDYRTVLGEHTVESAWTVNKLSATLSWLQSFSSLRDVVVAVMRRSLCYPLYRHWDLSLRVLQDVQDILQLGKKQALRCLLDIHDQFNASEPRYLLNQLYIRDYCVWIQHASSKQLASLGQAIGKVQVTKADMGLSLPEIEEAARLAVEEEVADDLASRLGQLSTSNKDSIPERGEHSSSDEYTSDSESSSDSSSIVSDSSSLDSDDVSSDGVTLTEGERE